MVQKVTYKNLLSIQKPSQKEGSKPVSFVFHGGSGSDIKAREGKLGSPEPIVINGGTWGPYLDVLLEVRNDRGPQVG